MSSDTTASTHKGYYIVLRREGRDYPTDGGFHATFTDTIATIHYKAAMHFNIDNDNTFTLSLGPGTLGHIDLTVLTNTLNDYGLSDIGVVSMLVINNQ
jgi:hypothetical protein